jgi:hypothetical protein
MIIALYLNIIMFSCTQISKTRDKCNASTWQLLYRGAMTLKHHFTEHPASVDETYLEHFKVAARFARCLSIAAGAAAVHAIIPSMCTMTASKRICELHSEMTAGKRGSNALESAA